MEMAEDENKPATTQLASKLNEVFAADSVEDLKQIWESFGSEAVEEIDPERRPILHRAVELGASECCKFLIDQLSSDLVNLCDVDGYSALHVAVTAESPDHKIVEMLLQSDLDVYLKSLAGYTALEVALGNLNTFHFLHDKLLKRSIAEKGTDSFTLVCDRSLGQESFPVAMKNFTSMSHVLEDYPHFYYVKKVFTGAETKHNIRMTDCSTCNCKDGCVNDCPCLSQGTVRYLSPGVIEVPEDLDLEHFLMECADSCKCCNCANRLTRENPTQPIELLFVSKSLGFTLQNKTKLPKGVFLGQYTGKIVDKAAAVEVNDDSYLFEIPSQLPEDDKLLIDTKVYGNFTRFINHSCNPNLFVLEVKQPDVENFSRLCFFTKCEIAEQRQLTVDYGDEFWNEKKKKLNCRCGFAACRYSDNSDFQTVDDKI